VDARERNTKETEKRVIYLDVYVHEHKSTHISVCMHVHARTHKYLLQKMAGVDTCLPYMRDKTCTYVRGDFVQLTTH